MTEFTRELMFGKRPLRRTNPKPGQSEYYYVDPRSANRFADMKQIDVPSADTPNPYAREIQQYLHDNDEFNYKQLYGDTPPPVQTKNSNIPQLQMPAGSEQQITMPKPQEPTAWNKFTEWAENTGDAIQAATVGYATGASLGNFDEAMGGATAAVTLNPDNYTLGRDATRNLQNNLQQRHPYIYGGSEFVGAMTTPMHLFKETSFANKARNALTDTINASVGYAENWNDFGTNLAINGAANTIGLAFDAIPILRTLGSNTGKNLLSSGKKFIKQGINSFADKLKNAYYKENEDEEKYY